MESWIPVLLGVTGSGACTALVSYLLMRNKTRAEAASLTAAAGAATADAQSQIIADLMRFNATLGKRVDSLEQRVATFDQRETRLMALLGRMTTWQRRAYDLLTVEHREQLGPPPADPDLIGS